MVGMGKADYIYFVQDPTTGTVKIGASQDPERRLENLQGGVPQELDPIRVVQVAEGTMFQVERLLHLKFEHLRVRGEWFRGTPELLAFAKQGDVPEALASFVEGLAPRTKSQGMSLTMLAQKAGVTERNIRYYISQKVLPPPLEVGRHAAYGSEHLERLIQILAWKREGLSIHDIQQRVDASWLAPLLTLEKWDQYLVAPDVKVFIRADLPPSRRSQVERNLLAFIAGVER